MERRELLDGREGAQVVVMDPSFDFCQLGELHELFFEAREADVKYSTGAVTRVASRLLLLVEDPPPAP